MSSCVWSIVAVVGVDCVPSIAWWDIASLVVLGRFGLVVPGAVKWLSLLCPDDEGCCVVIDSDGTRSAAVWPVPLVFSDGAG